ncbi:hypothetical protein M9H77_02877 [Catharanthus roseus]|uniref:Uncharacterized protein n=1 Tax=Catharanthus roseus TaxID=4058 RepID=A0ACC0C9L9_CATRO|nr:hypothetical protein M9H77_02877 [Catharanthus roseus]
MRRLAKGILNHVLPEDPGVTLTSSPEIVVTKGRKKTDSTKRDKSQEDMFLVLTLDLGRCTVRVLGRDPLGEGDCHELLGKGAEGAAVAEVILIGQLGSTTVLPLYSYSDRPEGTLVIGLLTERRHFIQLQLNDMCPIPPLHIHSSSFRMGQQLGRFVSA